MQVTIDNLVNAKDTARRMRILTEKYYLDVAPYASYSFIEFYDFVKDIPFIPDPRGVELIKRPIYTIKGIGAGGDCDDKSILFAAWAKLNGYSYRFIGAGRKKRHRNGRILLTHVFTQVYILGEWINADCTYSINTIGDSGDFDRYEVLA